jgi:hypothetical protein
MLRAEVIASPDLTEEDRLVAIGGYDVAYAMYAQPLLAKAGGTSPATRSGTPVTGLKAASAARKQQGDHATATALDAIALRLQGVREGDGSAPSKKSSDEVLAEAFLGLRAPMTAARAEGARAATLANALSLGMATDWAP